MRSSVYAINRKTLSAFRSEQNDQDSHHNLQKHEYIRLIAAAEWSNDDDKEFFSQDRNNRLNRGARYSSKLIPSTEPHHQHQNDPFVRYTVETPDMQRVINPLMKQANTASIALLFVLLIWRTFSCFEMAEQILSAHTKALLLVPATILTCANAIGFFVNLLKPMGFKNHLKVILALNLIREGIEMLFNVMMMIFSDSRELFFGRFFVNCWWFFLCYSFSKSRWVLETSIPTNRYEFYDSPPQPQASSAYSRRR
eukprot:gene26584-35252_t